MIRIALVDDHTILRKGVAELLSGFRNMAVVLEAGNGKELLEQLAVAETLPDICVVDINMPVMNGYDTVRTLRQKWPQIKVLALSMYNAEQNIIKMLRLGAGGYVLKDASPEHFKEAIEEIYTYGYYHSGVITERLRKMIESGSDRHLLTEKELEFLKLCCKDLTYKQIAEIMNLSYRTVDGYRDRLFLKLGASTRTGLVVYCIKSGLFTD